MAATAVEGPSPMHPGLMPAVHAVLEDFRLLESQPLQAAGGPGRATQGHASTDLRVASAEASQLLEVVKRACGPASRELLQHLGPLLSALAAGGVQVGSRVVRLCL